MTRNTPRLRALVGAAAALVALAAMTAAWAQVAFAARPHGAEAQHAAAVHSFRQGRFSEAYGRFIGLADAGHAPSARYALWMCTNGLALFGIDWDCAPHDAEAWARLAGVEAPRIEARTYPAVVAPVLAPAAARGRRP